MILLCMMQASYVFSYNKHHAMRTRPGDHARTRAASLAKNACPVYTWQYLYLSYHWFMITCQIMSQLAHWKIIEAGNVYVATS